MAVATTLVANGCSCEESPELIVDLKTDLIAGEEFVAIDLLVEGGGASRRIEVAAPAGTSWVAGRRLAEISGISAARYTLRTRLLDRAAVLVAERRSIVAVDGRTLVTVVISRDCRGVSCPEDPVSGGAQACHGGMCVDPRCTPETPMFCTPECATASDCTLPSACAIAGCESGVCLSEPSPAACSSSERCDLDRGCVPIDPMPDAGTDAGTDAGPPRCPEVCPSCSSGCCSLDCAAGPTCGGGMATSFCTDTCRCEATCSGTCDFHAEAGSTAVVTCRAGSECTMVCDDGSTCEMICEEGAMCALDCQDSASCVMRCPPAGGCGFACSTPDGMFCPGFVQTCRAPCP
jgi:hypothetical protein